MQLQEEVFRTGLTLTSTLPVSVESLRTTVQERNQSYLATSPEKSKDVQRGPKMSKVSTVSCELPLVDHTGNMDTIKCLTALGDLVKQKTNAVVAFPFVYGITISWLAGSILQKILSQSDGLQI